MPGRWQYQAKAEPLSRDSERIDPDKWLPSYPDLHPVRKPRLLDAITAGSYFAPALTFSIEQGSSLAGSISYNRRFQYQAMAMPLLQVSAAPAIEMKWYQPISQPVRRPRVPVQEGWSVACAIETPELYQWMQPLAQPVRRQGRAFWSGEFVAGSNLVGEQEAITLDKWFTPTSQPVRQPIRLLQEGWTVADPHEIERSVSEWFTEVSQPVRPKDRTAESLSVIDPTVLLAIQNDTAAAQMGWLPKHPDYISRSIDLRYLFESWFGDVDPANITIEIVTMDKWFTPMSEPVRVPPELVREGFSGPDFLQAIFTPADVEITIDKWIGFQAHQILQPKIFSWHGWIYSPAPIHGVISAESHHDLNARIGVSERLHSSLQKVSQTLISKVVSRR